MAIEFEYMYTVCFEIYGKKLKCTVEAKDEQQAKQIVRDKIIFHKVEKRKDEYNDTIDTLNNFANSTKR